MGKQIMSARALPELFEVAGVGNFIRRSVGTKHMYCEWRLGNGLREAEALAALAQRQGVVAVAGTQARVAPEVQFARGLIATASWARCCLRR